MQTDSERYLVSVENVSIALGSHRRPILTNATLRAKAGELICIIGPSGCGKSTLLKAIAGFVPVDAGRIQVGGVAVSRPGSDRGMVFQEFALFPWLTVEQNVLFGNKARSGTASEREARAMHYLSLVGLAEFRRYLPNQLSGGMKQRVALARAWANQPTVLLMDEPFGALDARTRRELQDTLLQIFEDERTCCFVTHDTEEAVYLADRIVVMSSRSGMRELEVRLPRPRDRYSNELIALVKQVDQLAWEAKLELERKP